MICYVFPFHSYLFFKFFYPCYLPRKYVLFTILIFQSIVYPKVKRNAQSESHVTNVDDDTNCLTGNTVNSDKEIGLPYDILKALERQNEGSKPNIEELEPINLSREGEEPKEIKIGAKFPIT